MWNFDEHSDNDNMRWTWLRAVEWGMWPLFISQPIAPIALLFWPWWSVIGIIIAVNFGWRLLIVPRAVSPALAYWGAMFAKLKWLACPIATYLLWHGGSGRLAIVALLWPLLVLFMPRLPVQIGAIQKMFLRSLFMSSEEGALERLRGSLASSMVETLRTPGVADKSDKQ